MRITKFVFFILMLSSCVTILKYPIINHSENGGGDIWVDKDITSTKNQTSRKQTEVKSAIGGDVDYIEEAQRKVVKYDKAKDSAYAVVEKAIEKNPEDTEKLQLKVLEARLLENKKTNTTNKAVYMMLVDDTASSKEDVIKAKLDWERSEQSVMTIKSKINFLSKKIKARR